MLPAIPDSFWQQSGDRCVHIADRAPPGLRPPAAWAEATHASNSVSSSSGTSTSSSARTPYRDPAGV